MRSKFNVRFARTAALRRSLCYHFERLKDEDSRQMGGAGAGALGLIIAALLYASPLTCLIVALITWILALPKWTVAAFVLFLAACCLHLIMWNVEPTALVGKFALFGSFALSAGALLMIPASLAFRIGTLIIAIMRRKQERRPHPEACE